MSEVTKVGTLIDETAKRDAIHIAVAPAMAGHILSPGEHVGFMLAGDTETVGRSGTRIGIVDPFLGAAVMPGERFWLFLYPYTITSLRHNWTHPAFADTTELAPAPSSRHAKEVSEQWLRDFIARADCPDYETVIAAAVNKSDSWSKEHLHFDGKDAHGEIPPEFWTHIEIVTGRPIPQEGRATYFSCAC